MRWLPSIFVSITRKSKVVDEEDVLNRIDKVDPSLVGGARLKGLLAVESRFIVEALLYLLEAPGEIEELIVKESRQGSGTGVLSC